MSHRWEHEDEVIQLQLAINHALREGNSAVLEELQACMSVFDNMRWQTKVAAFPELMPYGTVVNALQRTALKLGVPFPDLSNPRNRTGDGHFLFGVSDEVRTVQIWPMESRGYYNVELFDYAHTPDGNCYKGHTRSLAESTIVMSRWFVERCSIEALHGQCSWMSKEPFHLRGPRITFE